MAVSARTSHDDVTANVASDAHRQPIPSLALATGISAVLCAVVAAFEVRVGLGFADEGYLWYGVQRTVAGEWPVADFRSYDPGRYLWSATLQRLMGDGIISLRITVWVFAALGITAALLAARRVVHSIPALVAVAVGFVSWLLPRHKRYDCVLPLFGILAAVRMVERRDASSHVIAGVTAGLAAFFGRNHGLYLAVGMTLIVWVIAPAVRWGFLRRFAQLVGGAALGYSPMLVLFLVRPGMFDAFMQITKDIIQRGTNKPLPIPWPWLGGDAATVAFGLVLTAAPVVYLVTLFTLIRRRRSLSGPFDALLLSSAAIGLPYLHHAFSRADPQHLFQSAAPLILLVVTYIAQAWRHGRRGIAGGVVVASLVLTSMVAIPRWELYAYARSPGSFQETPVAGDDLVLAQSARKRLAFITTLSQTVGDDTLLVTGVTPTIYALLHKRAPIYDTYMVWPASPRRQQEMIEDLYSNDARWALITSVPRLRKKHPLLLRYIQDQWDKVELDGVPRNGALFRRPSTVS